MISENKFNKRLDDKNVIIKEYYEKRIKDFKKVYIKQSNGKNEHNIINCSLLKKEYYLENKKIGEVSGYNQNIKYLYAFLDQDDVMKCPSCGNTGNPNEFINGCPYCRTNFNIDYKERKTYHNVKLKEVLDKNTQVFIKTFILLFALCTSIIVFLQNGIIQDSIFITIFSYTFMFFLLILFGYILSSLILLLLLPILLYNDQRRLNLYIIWDRLKRKGYEINIPKFYNDLNYHMKNYYFDSSNTVYSDLIDFDILEYRNAKFKVINGKLNIKIKLKVREIYLKNNKIVKKIVNRYVLMEKNKNYIGHDVFNKLIKCKNCGNSISVIKDECEYCHTKINYINEWILNI